MTILKATIALDKRLATAFPSVTIVYEGQKVNPPTNSIYFRTQHVLLEPVDPVLGSRYRREPINYQVFVVSPTNLGVGEALTKAEEIQELYKRGTIISVDNLRIQIFNTPQIASATPISDKLVVPVIIPVTVEVYD